LLQCKKEALLSANTSPAYIAEIRGAESVPFFTDQELTQDRNIFHIPTLLKTDKLNSNEEVPEINADESSIIMFTSGSTGKPKAVKQRLTEFENDNRFVLSKWGDEFLMRKVCSTVSQHHIYGLLFSVLLPFTTGVPFRRKKIEIPEELETLSVSQYMIIASPAFLKRAVETENQAGINLKSPWIFTSGGVLNRDIAEKTCNVFGFWPVEVYGSTETSGIAWRQSVNGPEWTAFDNAELSRNNDGCLVIRSPYIKDPEGFETSDLVEMLDDKKFILKGRIDSVVKIEEKRISLAEIEERILQSGLAEDTAVIPFESKRQYLAAAIVFNNKGKEKFSGLEKHEINKFWREYLLQYFENIVLPKKWRYLQSIPADSQGKKKRDDIALLFSNEKSPGQSAGFSGIDSEKIIEKTENSVTLEFTLSDSCLYFDGHFPGFPVLPAVAQTELILRFASRYLGTNVMGSSIRRIKFSSFIRPFTPLVLKIEKNENSLLFEMKSSDGNRTYSQGSLQVTGDYRE
jgi:acyl-coenzyme A synthetase/AMP-(fatty) acid ligase